MRSRRLPFCVVLPLFSVCVWIVLVALPISVGDLHLRYMAHGASAVFLHAGTFSLTVPASRFLVFSANTVGEFKGQILTALNLPAFIVELLLSVRTWPTTWQPSGFTLWGWRALTFPIFALPAWYYIGVGIDGLLGSVGLHVWNAIVSSLFAAACAILGGGLTVALPAADREPGLKWITAGFMLWALLFGTVVVASVRQGRPKAAIFAQVLIGLSLWDRRSLDMD